MRRFHFYHSDTGILHPSGVSIDAPDAEKVAAQNCPDGHLLIEGNFDERCQRIDITTKQAVEHQPAALAEDRTSALQRLEASQHSLVRELLLGNEGARPRLQAIHDQIAALQAAKSEA
jgi:hypothetical protein